MSKKPSRVVQESISPYLTRQQVRQGSVNKNADVAATEETEKMATNASNPAGTEEVSNGELKVLLHKLNENMERNFAETNGSLKKLTEKVDCLECDIVAVEKKQMADHEKIEFLEQRVEELARKLLYTQRMSRKYNLVIHGVKGFEQTAEATIQRVRKFAAEDLGLHENVVKNLFIRNAHRLQKRDKGETPIIVALLKWSDKDLFLKNNSLLKGTGMRITPDLPPELKTIRSSLASEAYAIRRDESLQTRICDKGVDFWIETRKNAGDVWIKR